MGCLQAEGLAPGTVSNHVKGVKALFRASGLKFELPYSLSKRTVYSDRAPTTEELKRIIDLADVRKLYVKAGLITHKPLGRRYDLRAHSIRKFFRTQMAALGVDRD